MQPGLGNKNESAVYHPQTSGHNRDNKSEMKHHGSGLKIEQLTDFTNKKAQRLVWALLLVAEWTGLEPATPGVTGRASLIPLNVTS